MDTERDVGVSPSDVSAICFRAPCLIARVRVADLESCGLLKSKFEIKICRSPAGIMNL